jgi:hypothetical protein
LSQLPFDKATFEVITEKLRVHRALSVVLKGSSPTWSVIPVKSNNVAGEGMISQLASLVSSTTN